MATVSRFTSGELFAIYRESPVRRSGTGRVATGRRQAQQPFMTADPSLPSLARQISTPV
jgi:hypothetical protein